MIRRHPNLARARVLRRDLTEAERLIWRHLRRRQITGTKFRRQQPVGPYIVDFVCLDAMLVVELDGSQHGESEAIAYDAARTRYLGAFGYEVLRFWNGDAMARTMDVLETIYATVARRMDGRQLTVRAVAAGHLPPGVTEDD